MMMKRRMMMMMNMKPNNGGGGGNNMCSQCGNGPFYDGCNNCICDDTGRAACTRKSCLPQDYAFSYCLGPIKKEINCETCEEGFFTPDGCNECTCLDDGTAACTDRDCFPGLDAYCYAPPRISCDLVRCAEPPNCDLLGAGFELFLRPGECCPTCVDVGTVAKVAASCDTCSSGKYFDGCNWCLCDPDGDDPVVCEETNTCTAAEYSTPVCESQTVYCAAEVQTCPDGTEVGRDWRNGCSFFECPLYIGEDEVDPQVRCNGDLKFCPSGAFVGRNANDLCEFDICP